MQVLTLHSINPELKSYPRIILLAFCFSYKGSFACRSWKDPGRSLPMSSILKGPPIRPCFWCSVTGQWMGHRYVKSKQRTIRWVVFKVGSLGKSWLMIATFWCMISGASRAKAGHGRPWGWSKSKVLWFLKQLILLNPMALMSWGEQPLDANIKPDCWTRACSRSPILRGCFNDSTPLPSLSNMSMHWRMIPKMQGWFNNCPLHVAFMILTPIWPSSFNPPEDSWTANWLASCRNSPEHCSTSTASTGPEQKQACKSPDISEKKNVLGGFGWVL